MKIFLRIPWINTSTINQYLATFAVNILSITHGSTIGWSSPMIPYLKSEDTHLKSGPINATEASWIGKVKLNYDFFFVLMIICHVIMSTLTC